MLKSSDNSHLSFLTTYAFPNKIRFGNKHDGGYVVANVPNYDCYLSIGIGDDESFSRDLINYFTPLNSFAIENNNPTILPGNFPSSMTHIPKNLGTSNTDFTTNLEEMYSKYNDIFIKMDIEGFEYEYILSVDRENMKKIKQIVFELHGINDNGFVTNNTHYVPVGNGENTFQLKKEFLNKMNQTHYLVHVHYNCGGGCTLVNDTGVDKIIPNVLEVAYVRKDLIKNPQLNTQLFPLYGLDYPNYTRPDLPEMCKLTYPPFCFPK